MLKLQLMIRLRKTPLLKLPMTRKKLLKPNHTLMRLLMLLETMERLGLLPCQTTLLKDLERDLFQLTMET